MNSLSFPNQIKPDRSDSWAIVFGAPRGTLFLNTLCTTRHMVNQDLMDVKFYSTNICCKANQSRNSPSPHKIRTLSKERIERLRSAWRSAVGTTGNPHERLSRAERERDYEVSSNFTKNKKTNKTFRIRR